MAIINGTPGVDTINSGLADDIVFGRGGSDILRGWGGFDVIFGDAGDDLIMGGTRNDNLYGGTGNDRLHGDNGTGTAKGSDFGSDRLDAGSGNDVVHQSDGNDTVTLGAGADTFRFKWQDPMIDLAVGTGRSFTNLTDFDPGQDKLAFDVAGLGFDARGANFVDGGNGTNGGQAASFFKGAAASSNGQSVMVLTDQGFATGIDAVTAARNEDVGDFVIYFNTTVNVGSLLFVDGPDTAHSIARFANIDSLADLRTASFDAGDFLFRLTAPARGLGRRGTAAPVSSSQERTRG